jgi:hypothetical protein
MGEKALARRLNGQLSQTDGTHRDVGPRPRLVICQGFFSRSLLQDKPVKGEKMQDEYHPGLSHEFIGVHQLGLEDQKADLGYLQQ